MEPTTLIRNSEAEAGFMSGVYRWMASGLFITALVSFIVVTNEALLSFIFTTPFLFPALIILELGVVFYLSWKVQSLSTETAALLFFAYAALNGVTLSTIFLIYTINSIASVFLTAAGTFGLMSIYGATTKRDLTSVGAFAIMGLLGLIVASIVNFFIGNEMANMTISAIGVLVFVALTAYDTQKIKEMRVPAVIGALELYLDFINLFISLLRLLGTRRD